MIETDPATEISARPGGAAPVAAAGPDTAAEEGSVLAALAQTAFRRLWLAELLSQTALNAIWYAAIVATELETHSTTQISLTVVSAPLPVGILGVLAGILVVSWNKNQVLVW
ncbi:MAG: hypothetical protein ACTHMP_02145, partial [Thermomicrobiales bacterium]